MENITAIPERFSFAKFSGASTREFGTSMLNGPNTIISTTCSKCNVKLSPIIESSFAINIKNQSYLIHQHGPYIGVISNTNGSKKLVCKYILDNYLINLSDTIIPLSRIQYYNKPKSDSFIEMRYYQTLQRWDIELKLKIFTTLNIGMMPICKILFNDLPFDVISRIFITWMNKSG